MAASLMITRRELRQQARRQRVSLGALEKDYVLTLILQRIYDQDVWRENLVFKGGTALHKLYLNRRLCLDLDFTSQRPITLKRSVRYWSSRTSRAASRMLVSFMTH